MVNYYYYYYYYLYHYWLYYTGNVTELQVDLGLMARFLFLLHGLLFARVIHRLPTSTCDTDLNCRLFVRREGQEWEGKSVPKV